MKMISISLILCLSVAGICFADVQQVSVNIATNIDLAEDLIHRGLRGISDVELIDFDIEGKANWSLEIVILYHSNMHTGVLHVWHRSSEMMDFVEHWYTNKIDIDSVDMGSIAVELTWSFQPWITYWAIERELSKLVERLILRFDELLDEFRPGGRRHSEIDL